MVRGDLKNMERNLSHIFPMYRPFLMVVHLIFTHCLAQGKRSAFAFVFGLITQTSITKDIPNAVVHHRWTYGNLGLTGQ